MNTTLSTPRRHNHPPIELKPSLPTQVRRVGLVDRVALHLGVALIKWGRRPLSREKLERRANRIERQYTSTQLEALAERSRRLSQPF